MGRLLGNDMGSKPWPRNTDWLLDTRMACYMQTLVELHMTGFLPRSQQTLPASSPPQPRPSSWPHLPPSVLSASSSSLPTIASSLISLPRSAQEWRRQNIAEAECHPDSPPQSSCHLLFAPHHQRYPLQEGWQGNIWRELISLRSLALGRDSWESRLEGLKTALSPLFEYLMNATLGAVYIFCHGNIPGGTQRWPRMSNVFSHALL